jgi:hypothetical protein
MSVGSVIGRLSPAGDSARHGAETSRHTSCRRPGDNGILDLVFYRFQNGERWELGPTSTTAYVPLSNVLKVTTDMCLGSEIASGIK